MFELIELSISTMSRAGVNKLFLHRASQQIIFSFVGYVVSASAHLYYSLKTTIDSI